MITEKEQQATLLSATKKDYYQIWNELLETAGKISERWDPTTTNESDPGIVLLKLLTGIADKLNYTIDKNILEAFMPSAAQEESMRKLCEMMGYSMSYYKSATTDVTIYYSGSSEDWQSGSEDVGTLILPVFTQITNVDQDIVYTTTEQAVFNDTTTLATVSCIEGTLGYCEEDNNGIVTIDNLDDNNRYYLPSAQIAENGIFVYNISDGTLNSEWTQVDNLNTQELEKRVYKFGYDSQEFLPYLEFPSDISSLIEDGLSIAYITTSGVNGNVSAKTLTSFETPSEWELDDSTETNSYNTTGVEHTADEFVCYNASAATNGADKESLNDAYKNFKKTIGTFDTLVTCRDYMNKIYQLTVSDTDSTPLVSNSIVSDIRDDINRAVTLCTFGDTGIKYIDQPLTETATKTVTVPKSSIEINGIAQGTIADGNAVLSYKDTQDMIDHFDLLLYPFKTVSGLNTKSEYDNSFKNAGQSVADEVIDSLADYKTISHKINLPDDDEIMCVKNYLRLNAKISTATKVNAVEWQAILANIKEALYEAFNCRELDFGEAIPFDDILKTIQDADTNIKNVALEEPTLYTSIMTADNKEYLLPTANNEITDSEIKAKFTSDELEGYIKKDASRKTIMLTEKREKAQELYNKLALKNALAGRVELFNYNTEFTTTIAEKKNPSYNLIYPTQFSDNGDYISRLEPRLTIYAGKTDIELTTNQIVQFRAPNFATEISYPAYVNYFIKINKTEVTAALPATFKTLYDFMNEDKTVTGNDASFTMTAANFATFMNKMGNSGSQYMTSITSSETTLAETYGHVFKRTALYLVTGTDLDATITAATENGGTAYVVPSVTIDSGTADKTDFDGKIYRLDSTLRCSDAAGTAFLTSGSYLKISDSYTEADVTAPAVTLDLTENYNKIFSTEPQTEDQEPSLYLFEAADPTTASASNTLYVYPLTSNTYGIWFRWIQQFVEFEGTDSNEKTDYEITLSGLYRNLGSDQSRIIGSMVDENKNKYQLSNTWYSTASNPLEYYYVQYVHLADNPQSTSSSYGWTKTGFGKDAVYSSLTADSEYQLTDDEFLCINYTDASTSVSEADDTSSAASLETTSTVVNTYYGAGTIIRPNFALIDSLTKKNSSSYSKTSGYDLSEAFGSSYKDDVPGMFSLGTDEQIDIRRQVSTYVYDELNTQSNSKNIVYVYFSTNDGESVFLDKERGSHRTLEEGEYFWYTDRNKQTLTYCGEGSEIYNYTGSAIEKTDDDTVSTEDILTNGISVVPWIKLYNLYMKDPDATWDAEEAEAGNLGNFIKWDEYQYIDLMSGDTLSSFDLNGEDLTNEWKQCKNAAYILNDSAASLPAINVKDSAGNDIKWSARTLLSVTISPSYAQKLTTTEGIAEEKLLIYYTDKTGAESDTAKDTLENVSIKSNYTVSTATDSIDTTYNLYNENNELVETVTDFKLKVFDAETISLNETTSQSTEVTLNNMSNYYTNISFEDYITPENELLADLTPYTSFYSVMDNNGLASNGTHTYNLIMLYYQTSSTAASACAKIRVTTSTPTENQETPFNSIFNYSYNGATWWDGYTDVPDETLYYKTDILWGKDAADNEYSRLFEYIDSDGSFKDLIAKAEDNKGGDFGYSTYKCTAKEATEIEETDHVLLIDGTYYEIEKVTSFSTAGAGYYAVIKDIKAKDPSHTFWILKPGINVIKLSGDGTTADDLTIEVYPGDDLTDLLTIGQLDNVTESLSDSDLGLNLSLLGYSDPEGGSANKAATDLLAAINEIDADHIFYYNAVLDNSVGIDINEAAGELLSIETMWYDYNNINNKFVVSEIDSDYIDTGITLAKSSSK